MWEDRYPRILAEIKSWSPDVLCMQGRPYFCFCIKFENQIGSWTRKLLFSIDFIVNGFNLNAETEVCSSFKEVQRDHFESNFRPDLAALGYGAVYKKRTAEKNDGCAIFYKTEKFALADWTSVEYFQPCVDVLNRD